MVEVRMKRQELLLDGPGPPLLFFVLDEGIIQRLVGDEGLRQGQVEKLIHMADRPEVTIEIVPFSTGIHRGMIEDFSILEFGGTDDNDVLYFGGAGIRAYARDEAEEIVVYRELFEEMRNLSLGPKGTRRLPYRDGGHDPLRAGTIQIPMSVILSREEVCSVRMDGFWGCARALWPPVNIKGITTFKMAAWKQQYSSETPRIAAEEFCPSLLQSGKTSSTQSKRTTLA